MRSYVTVLAALTTAMASAQPATPVVATPTSTIGTAMAAATACEGSVTTGRVNLIVPAEFYAPTADGKTIKGFDALPDLMKRVVATSGMIDAPAMLVKLPLDTGQVWVILRSSRSTCDIVATGFTDPVLADELRRSFTDNPQWQTIAQRTATPAAPMTQIVMIKRLPSAEAPAFGIKASLRDVGSTVETAAGVQVQVTLTAGDIVLKGSAAAASAK